jgi:hypothetical protein
VAVSVLILVGLYLILILEAAGRKRSAAVTKLCLALLGAYGVVLAFPFTREFFELALPGVAGWLTALGGASLAVLGLWLSDERFAPGGEVRAASGGGVGVAEVDEPVHGANHERPADEVAKGHGDQVVEEERSPREA